MLHVQADTLSFTVAGDWSEMNLGQFLAYLNSSTDAELLSVLSGIPIEELRPQKAVDLSRIFGQLAYLEKIPDWKTLPVPTRLTLEGKRVSLPADLGEMAIVGQMWDVEKVYRSMLTSDQNPTYLTMAETVLSIFLYPIITGEVYTNDEQASHFKPLLNTLPVNEALPLAAYLFECWKNPVPSGRISVTQIPPAKPKPWYNVVSRIWSN